jgi:lysozyme family protein
MDRNFERALSAVLKHEGGYSNHPEDKGGPTNKGVTLANFRAFVKPGGTVEDLKKLTVAQAGVVYRRHYWDEVMGNDLPDGVDYAVFDFAVNSGPSRAAKFLQKVVGVAEDGKIGPVTLKAAKAMDAPTLVNRLLDARMAWLQGLSNFPTFGRGWTSRVAGVRALALELAQQPYDAPKVVVETTPPEGAEKTAPLNVGIAVTGVGALGQFLAGLHPVVQGGGMLLIAVGLFVLWRDRASIAKGAREILQGRA